MKILIILNSNFYTDKQNDWCYDNMIEIDWNIPALPRIGEFFDCNSIIDNMPDFDDGCLCWSVEYVEYRKIDGAIVPTIRMIGE